MIMMSLNRSQCAHRHTANCHTQIILLCLISALGFSLQQTGYSFLMTGVLNHAEGRLETVSGFMSNY